jgi:hypothetical protein
MEQKKESKSKFCAAAKRYPTKGKAYEAFNNDQSKNGIFLIEEIINGQIKHICYGRCCNSVQDNELCHIHENQKKKEKSGFLYFEKDIKNKCDDTKIKKATSTMSYFKQMGDRGRNKSSKTTYHDFKNEDDPILKVIKHDKNPKLLKSLKIYAVQLLNEQNISVKAEKEEVKYEKEAPSKNKELIDTIERLNIEHKKFKETKEEELPNNNLKKTEDLLENLKINDSDNEESDNEIKESDDKIKESDDEIEESEDEIEESDDEFDVEKIYTKKNKLLYLEPNSMTVLEPEGDEDGTSIGILNKISEIYSTIVKDGSYYTVFSQKTLLYNNNDNEIEFYRDVLNNNIFEMIEDEFIYKGKVTKNKKSEFDFDFEVN